MTFSPPREGFSLSISSFKNPPRATLLLFTNLYILPLNFLCDKFELRIILTGEMRMRLSDIVGEKLAAIIHSPASTYTGGAVSASSGVGALVDPHNVIFIIGTFGGLLFAWLTYRSRRRRDDEMRFLDRQRTEQHRKMADALVDYLSKNSDSLKDIDKAPEVVREITDTIRRETIVPEVERRNKIND